MHNGLIIFSQLPLRCWSVLHILTAVSFSPLLMAKDQVFSDYARTIPGTQVKFDRVALEDGIYPLGSSLEEIGHQQEESPLVQVRVSSFWMGRHEVTWAEYHEFMK